MLFEVDRASLTGDENICPCDGAQRCETTGSFGNKLTAWLVELNTLEDLMAFVDKYGDCVLRKNTWFTDNRALLIYDDYIE